MTTSEAQETTSKLSNCRLLSGGAVGLLIILLLVGWAGAPPPDQIRPFIIGVILLLITLVGFWVVAWHLLLRPLPVDQQIKPIAIISAPQRQTIAIALLVAQSFLIVGAMWDEVWHRTYGTPFGEDLLWRPHLLMYSCFLLVTLLAVIGLVRINQEKGSLQQKFRRDPLLGTLVVLSGFLLLMVPADPIWHIIYGEDIAAWSLPHIMLALSFAAVAILNAAVQISLLARPEWQSLLKMHITEIIVFISFGFLAMFAYQILTAEYDSLEVLSQSYILQLSQRPPWLLIVNIVAISVFTSTSVLHALKRYGAATLAMLIPFVIRLILVITFDYPGVSTDAWLIGIFPALAIDMLYFAYHRQDRQVPLTALVTVVTAVGVIVLVPVTNALFAPLPPITEFTTLLATAVAIAVITFLSAGAGRTLGNALVSTSGFASLFSNSSESKTSLRYGMMIVLSLLVVVVFLAIFIGTATPPIPVGL